MWILTVSLTSVAAFAVTGVAVIYALGLLKTRRQNYPPGPIPLPVIGNLLQLAFTQKDVLFTKWRAAYGDVVYLRIFGKPIVVLNSLKAARDLFDKRSSLYSDRPRMLLTELMGWERAATHIRYGPRLRRYRRWLNQTFNKRAVADLVPLQMKEALSVIDTLITDPENFSAHFRKFTGATVLKIMYGYDINPVDDPLINIVERATTMTVQSGTPAATMVDFVPALRYLPAWFPFTSFLRKVHATRPAVDDMMNIPFNLVKQQMNSGIAPNCFTARLLGNLGKDTPTTGEKSTSLELEEDVKGVAGTTYAAAVDTTLSVLRTFVLCMVVNPAVFKKMQEEMDRVTKRARLPTIKDKDKLVYIDCVLKEVIRWNPTVPLGMPHRLMEDDCYKSFIIPKGATIMTNIYAILHDCPQPKEFRPERFVTQNDLPDPWKVIFGFGRRICPGRYYAQTSVWCIVAHMVATLDISRAVDEHGVEIVPDTTRFETGFVSHPVPFTCGFKPRDEKIVELVRQAKGAYEHY